MCRGEGVGDYVGETEEGTIKLKSDDFRKYLRERMSGLKNEIELLLIDVIEKSTDMGEQFVYLPALYKHVKDNKQLSTEWNRRNRCLPTNTNSRKRYGRSRVTDL